MSSLDSQVVLSIVNDCFHGFLNNTTRIVFANSLSYLEKADRYYILDDGTIKHSGNYKEIKEMYTSILYSKKNDSNLEYL